MVALDLPSSPTRDSFLTAFGKERDFSRPYVRYPVPADLELSVRLFQANCGPASFAALTGLLVTEIIRFFPHFPLSPHTNIPQMSAALGRCGIAAQDNGGSWPEDGICLIQINGPWTQKAWPADSCRRRHWVAVRNGFVYDVNVNRWTPRYTWQSTVMDRLAAAHSRSTGWRLMKSLRVEPLPTSFPEFSSTDRRRSTCA